MKPVSEVLLETIKELQSLPSLYLSTLGGGTNLAIRYGHRVSDDIDLFFPEIIGKLGYQKILEEVKEFYGSKVLGDCYPCDESDQFMFLRFFIVKNGLTVKVEILQNMLNFDEAEIINDVKLMTENDIGKLKLMSASNRASEKDTYDLDYLTDNIPLSELIKSLKEKQNKFNEEKHKNIFDLDKEISPIDDPLRLLRFEYPTNPNDKRPLHSDRRIKIIEGQKSWLTARSNWKRKVRAYFREIDVEYPKPKPFD